MIPFHCCGRSWSGRRWSVWLSWWTGRGKSRRTAVENGKKKSNIKINLAVDVGSNNAILFFTCTFFSFCFLKGIKTRGKSLWVSDQTYDWRGLGEWGGWIKKSVCSVGLSVPFSVGLAVLFCFVFFVYTWTMKYPIEWILLYCIIDRSVNEKVGLSEQATFNASRWAKRVLSPRFDNFLTAEPEVLSIFSHVKARIIVKSSCACDHGRDEQCILICTTESRRHG